MRSLENILWLGLKELRSFLSDATLFAFVIYAFTVTVYSQATGTSNEVNNASIAFADEDQSALSQQLVNAFYPPRFQRPDLIHVNEVEEAMDRGRYMFVVTIPPFFEHDLRAGRHPDIQVSIDATAMQQAGIGAGYIKNIIKKRVATFLTRRDVDADDPVKLIVRKAFNPNGVSAWFTSVVGMINQLTLLTIVLTGAAVIREREHGTLEHLLVMPLSAFEIAIAKVWSNGLVILLATALSLFFVALGIFLGTVSRSMAQFALLIILVVVVLQLLSGGSTPVESQPAWLQKLTYLLPSRHFVSFSQVIIYRGGGIAAVWRHFAVVGAVGLVFFWYSLAGFRKSIAAAK